MDALKRHLVCVDRTSGDIRWNKVIDPVLPEDPFSGAGVPTHGYASHSPVSDGKRVYVFFGKTGAMAFDLEGNQIWHKKLGTESDPRRWGSSSSPILHGGVLIVTASAESRSIVGLNSETGEELWRSQADGVMNTWATPVICKINDEQSEIVLGVPYELWALNPKNGKLRWYAEVPASDQANASAISEGGVIYLATGGRGGGGTAAVKAGGKNDVTESNVLWTNRIATRFGSPLLYEGRIYVMGSIAACMDAKTGEAIYEQRLPGGTGGGGGRRGFGGSDYTSPVIAGGNIYFVRGSGETLVVKTGDKFEEIASNRVTEDRENFMASPAISKGELFLRSDKHLYCVAETK